MTLSPTQAAAMKAIRDWHWSGGDEFRMGGLAGTGKTTIVTQLPDYLDLEPEDVHYCAPTGKAASVLTRKLDAPLVATTVHSLMYKPADFHCAACPRSFDSAHEGCHGFGECGCYLSFRYDPPNPPPPLIVVDEASMVDKAMYEDLRRLGAQVLYVGDHGQLPPVRGGVNLMDEEHLDVRLEEIHRQAKDSPILRLAMMAREGKKTPLGEYGPGVQVVSGKGFEFDASPDALLLCYTNETRMRLNRLVRQAFGHPEHNPVVGDRVVCLRNNREAGVANGMLGTIEDIRPSGPHFFQMVARMQDGDERYRGRVLARQFTQAETQHLRGVDSWTYGYCLTTHKAQGSESDEVIVFKEEKMGAMSPRMRRRWLYTAYTRAKSSLTVVEG
jgi:exodeoxyribonuclease-5